MARRVPTDQPDSAPERAAYYRRIAAGNLAPLWESLKQLVPRAPQSPAIAHCWRYDDVRPFLREAGELISAREAERRVLILENPGLPGQARITATLYAGLQLILPGEVAPAHRHTQSALRFVLEGAGAYTAVDGEKTIMHEGDFVITPSWTWHEHGNDSDRPMVWLDGLDIPLVAMFDAGFAENHPDERHPLSRPAGDSLARYGQGLLPVDHVAAGSASPVFNYPYARTRAALEQLRRGAAPDPFDGVKARYANPLDGGWPLPTIGAFMQLLPKGFATEPQRSTDGTVFVCVEGAGHSAIGERRIDWGPRDIFVAPSWHWRRHAASADSVLFSFSDRPVQERLGLFRQQRGN